MQKFLLVINLVLLCLVQTTASANNSPIKLLIMGDSLSAAHNIPVAQSWPELFASNMRSSFPQTSVINASISGETSFGGSQRLAELIARHQPSHLIIELGGNDGLRGLDFQSTGANLRHMVSLARQNNISVLLIGVRMPPNLGPAYNQRFQQIFESIAAESNLHYLPRFLEGVAAADPALMQSDGIHPTELAQPILARKVYLAVQAMLAQP